MDIELTNGVNTITLHATDMAGNSSATVLTYILDLASGTNGCGRQTFIDNAVPANPKATPAASKPK